MSLFRVTRSVNISAQAECQARLSRSLCVQSRIYDEIIISIRIHRHAPIDRAHNSIINLQARPRRNTGGDISRIQSPPALAGCCSVSSGTEQPDSLLYIHTPSREKTRIYERASSCTAAVCIGICEYTHSRDTAVQRIHAKEIKVRRDRGSSFIFISRDIAGREFNRTSGGGYELLY